MQYFIHKQPFVSIWLGAKTLQALLQRFTRAEIITGFEQVAPLESMVKELDVELKMLTKQHESRLQAAKGTPKK